MNQRIVIDATATVGLATLATGVWLVSPPAALIVVGSLLLIGGIVGAIRYESEGGDNDA